MDNDDELGFMEWMFIGEYLKDWNGTAAMRRLKAQGIYEGEWPAQDGSRMLRKPRVLAEVTKARKALIDSVKLDVELVVRDIKAVLEAPSDELTSHHKDCCRYCHGRDHEYQFTPAEWKRAETTHMGTDAYNLRGEQLDPQGGVGFDPRREPLDDCPECHGRGVMTIKTVDTRHMSPGAAAMYVGVKPGKHGAEVMMRSKDSARDAAAKYLGMNKETVNLFDGNAKDLDDDALATIIEADKAKKR